MGFRPVDASRSIPTMPRQDEAVPRPDTDSHAARSSFKIYDLASFATQGQTRVPSIYAESPDVANANSIQEARLRAAQKVRDAFAEMIAEDPDAFRQVIGDEPKSS